MNRYLYFSFIAVCILISHMINAQESKHRQIPLEKFAKLPSYENPQLSPDGKRVAVVLLYEDKQYIAVEKLLTPDDDKKEPLYILPTWDYRVSWFRWKNNERIIVSIRSEDSLGGVLINTSRLFSYGLKSGEAPIQFKMEADVNGWYRQHANVVNWLVNDPDHILVALDDSNWARPNIDKVNVYTGEKKSYIRNNLGFYSWLADNDGNVRLGIKPDIKNNKKGVTLYYRETEDDKWEILQKADYFDDDRLLPAQFDEDDPNILLLSTAELEDSDVSDHTGERLYRYDLTQRKVLGPYIDKRKEKILDMVRKALPDREVDIVSNDRVKNRYMFRVYSDIKPAEYYLLDMKQKKLELIESEFPELSDATLSPMKRVSYKARDGLEIPAFLTLPTDNGAKNLPVIVFPHGGPWEHDRWGFDNYVQFFASRGYAVFQPQFRGSTGLGIDHLEAGFGQWGMTIQDDITDGVIWLIKEKIADPDRICIAGSSFGGYAAAVGIAKTPELFCCAISINGILDLKKFIDSGRSMLFENINRVVWNKYRTAEENSPYHLAENIKAPLLLIGSEKDTVVPVEHSKKMHMILKKHNKSVEFIELPGGEHWQTTNANELLKFKAMEDFLIKYIPGEKRDDLKAPVKTGMR